jgi:hypothetical protein
VEKWRLIGAALLVLFAGTHGRFHAEPCGRRNARNAKASMSVARKKLVKQETLKNAGGIYENLYAGAG